MDREIIKVINKVKKDKDVLALALFGSSLKGPGRDIDLCIFLNKKMTNLEMSNKQINLSKEINKKVDIQIFQQLPVYIRIRIIREGKILFCRDMPQLYEIAFSTIKEFDSFKKVYYMYLNEVKNGPRKNTLKI